MALSARVISVLKPYFQQFFLSFKVEDWPLAAAGKFFSEEVYIVLNCISQEKTSMMVRNKKTTTSTCTACSKLVNTEQLSNVVVRFCLDFAFELWSDLFKILISCNLLQPIKDTILISVSFS